jgi:hypothetical protein
MSTQVEHGTFPGREKNYILTTCKTCGRHNLKLNNVLSYKETKVPQNVERTLYFAVYFQRVPASLKGSYTSPYESNLQMTLT